MLAFLEKIRYFSAGSTIYFSTTGTKESDSIEDQTKPLVSDFSDSPLLSRRPTLVEGAFGQLG
jgi:hypothetical protein